jgi:hypothetical protein
LGDQRGATLSFLKTRETDVEEAPPPWALSSSAFERRVQSAVRRLDESLARVLEGALVVICDLPGAEVVAEGIDPHVGVLIDDLLDHEGKPVTPQATPERAGRLFVYQRNIERWIQSASEVDDEILRNLEHEIMLAFPQLSPKDAPEE